MAEGQLADGTYELTLVKKGNDITLEYIGETPDPVVDVNAATINTEYLKQSDPDKLIREGDKEVRVSKPTLVGNVVNGITINPSAEFVDDEKFLEKHENKRYTSTRRQCHPPPEDGGEQPRPPPPEPEPYPEPEPEPEPYPVLPPDISELKKRILRLQKYYEIQVVKLRKIIPENFTIGDTYPYYPNFNNKKSIEVRMEYDQIYEIIQEILRTLDVMISVYEEILDIYIDFRNILNGLAEYEKNTEGNQRNYALIDRVFKNVGKVREVHVGLYEEWYTTLNKILNYKPNKPKPKQEFMAIIQKATEARNRASKINQQLADLRTQHIENKFSLVDKHDEILALREELVNARQEQVNELEEAVRDYPNESGQPYPFTHSKRNQLTVSEILKDARKRLRNAKNRVSKINRGTKGSNSASVYWSGMNENAARHVGGGMNIWKGGNTKDDEFMKKIDGEDISIEVPNEYNESDPSVLWKDIDISGIPEVQTENEDDEDDEDDEEETPIAQEQQEQHQEEKATTLVSGEGEEQELGGGSRKRKTHKNSLASMYRANKNKSKRMLLKKKSKRHDVKKNTNSSLKKKYAIRTKK